MSKRFVLVLEVATAETEGLLNPVALIPEGGEEVYLVLVLTKLLLLLVVVEDEDDKGTVPVGSNPLDLFRQASGHPDALQK